MEAMRQNAWRIHLAAGAALVALFVIVPPLRGNDALVNLVALSAALAVAAGVRLHRPASRPIWDAFMVGLALFWLADLYAVGYPFLTGDQLGYPSVADAAAIAAYPALAAGLLGLARRRTLQPDGAGLTDAVIITIGLSLPAWVYLIAPALHDSPDLLGTLTSVARPLGDLLLAAAAVRIAVDAGRRPPAFYLLAASIMTVLVTDFVHGLALRSGADYGLLPDLGRLVFAVLWGAAALHPSMAELEQPTPPVARHLTPGRLSLLTAACLMAPVLLFVQLTTATVDIVVVAGAAVALVVLALSRMTGLVREEERVVERERVLGAVGEQLLASTSGEETTAAFLDGARRIAGPDAEVVLRAPGDSVPPPADAAGRFTFDLRPRGEHVGTLDIRTKGAIAPGALTGLDALSTQVSLAMESAALQQEVQTRRVAARYQALIQHSSDLITVMDRAGRIAYQSPSIGKLLGYEQDEIVGTSVFALVSPADEPMLRQLLHAAADGRTEVLECKLVHRDGTARDVEVQLTDLCHDEDVGGIVLNARDVSERRAVEEQLAHQAFHDPVTDLANRALFAERVRHAIARQRRDAMGLAVLFIDLDDFKVVNDSLGHDAGDRVLVEVAHRLSDAIRASDTAARLGGDEFAILLEGVRDAQEAADSAERLLESLTEPIQLPEKELSQRCSMGIAVIEEGVVNADANADTLIRDADAAMYIAKSDGMGSYRLFEPAMHQGVLARLELRSDLQRALHDGEFELYYQPLMQLTSGALKGFEALLRWRQPNGELVPPDEFIGFAEETGLIVPIGRWALREGCRQAVVLNALREDERPLYMSVNLSVKQLQHADIVTDVREALETTGLDPALLMLEITETMMMIDTDNAIRRLEALKAIGVRLAMDDFGTGYSSLSYLHRFPVDVLKMDRSFLTEHPDGLISDLAGAVVAIGEKMQLDVIAEGIEHAEQWTSLRDLGCQLGQGFHFARPMEPAAAEDFVRAQSGVSSAPV